MPYKDEEKNRECKRSYYLANKDKAKASLLKRREKCRAYSREQMTPCVDCGAFNPDFMDWHHIDPSTKHKGISRLIRDGCSRLLKTEIEKCICLCSNCHRLRHATDGV